jgi:dienelactone hydrolase
LRAMLPALVAAAACVRGASTDAASEPPAAPAVGLQTQVAFSEYSPLSTSSEVVRRLLSPLTAAQVQRSLEHSGERLREQSVDLAAERFVLYLPPRAPAAGYALLTFVPPWDEARLPPGWAAVLDRYGVIFVSAARSGNDTDPIGRREPLALLGAYNVMQRYPIDSARVYVGGFSGGSRIALRLAIAYPDLFRGALLNAGSDPIDAGHANPPPRELLERFQESTRLVYVTGEHDAVRPMMDTASLDSMRDWCVFDTTSRITYGAAHEIVSPAALTWALTALAEHARTDAAKLAACRASLEQRLSASLARVHELVDAGKRHEARKALEDLDYRFGGLAAPQSLALVSALE